jgi:hypothetical protein
MSITFPNTQYQTQVSYPAGLQGPGGSQSSGGIRSQIKQDVQSLASELQSGDLTGAQNSFADIQKILQSSGAISAANNTASTAAAAASTTTGTGSNPIVNDFEALGQALSSGDLAGAQKDFTQLQTDVTAAQTAEQQSGTGQVGGHHHRHHGGPPPPPDNTDGTDSTSSTTSTSSGSNLQLATSPLATTNIASATQSFALQAYQSISFSSTNSSTDPISLNPQQSFSYAA